MLARLNLTHWRFSAAIKQLFVFAQNVNIVELVRISWPESYKKIMTAFTLVSLSLDVTAPECMAEGVTWHVSYALLLIPPAQVRRRKCLGLVFLTIGNSCFV